VLSGTGLCDELISRPEESYRLWCVVVCDLETTRMRRPWPALSRSATKKKRFHPVIFIVEVRRIGLFLALGISMDWLSNNLIFDIWRCARKFWVFMIWRRVVG
jgi:hypothetical protein